MMLTKKETLQLLEKINKALDKAIGSFDAYSENLKVRSSQAEKEPRREAA